MRVAVQGAEDLLDFTCISGQWVSENCEPVGVEFAWQHGCLTEIVEEGDCICSQELASLLINRLLSEADEPEMTARASGVDRT
jgi:hypothetical protein